MRRHAQSLQSSHRQNNRIVLTGIQFDSRVSCPDIFKRQVEVVPCQTPQRGRSYYHVQRVSFAYLDAWHEPPEHQLGFRSVTTPKTNPFGN